MSLRERQTANRRRQMLDAAEALIRQSGSTDFSMRVLATAAEVSPATPYNFFGSKEGLLFALLQRTLDVFMTQGLSFVSTDPFEQAIEAAENAVDLLLSDTVLMRPLYQVMLGLSDAVHHPQFIQGAFAFYRRALQGLVDQGVLSDAAERDTHAFSLMAHFIGVLNLWVQDDIDDDYFRAQVILGFIQLLWPLSSGPHAVLERRHKEVRQVLCDPALRPAFFNGLSRD